MNNPSHHLDSPDRFEDLRKTISKKRALRGFYTKIYDSYQACLSRCPANGIALELGSGGGFAQEMIPEIVTSDIIPYPGIDRVVDARNLPFDKNSIKLIVMNNVFHHIDDIERFFHGVERTLVPGGRIFIVDHDLGPLSRFILRFLHHENYNPNSKSWSFQSDGPLSGSNTALFWIVFERDKAVFQKKFPTLQIVSKRPRSAFFYWFAGGLKSWTLIPSWDFAISVAWWLDEISIWASRGHLATFVDIEIVKN